VLFVHASALRGASGRGGKQQTEPKRAEAGRQERAVRIDKGSKRDRHGTWIDVNRCIYDREEVSPKAMKSCTPAGCKLDFCCLRQLSLIIVSVLRLVYTGCFGVLYHGDN
jgi:hypothetical protein